MISASCLTHKWTVVQSQVLGRLGGAEHSAAVGFAVPVGSWKRIHIWQFDS